MVGSTILTFFFYCWDSVAKLNKKAGSELSIVWGCVCVCVCVCVIILRRTCVIRCVARNGELRTQKLKSYLLRTQSLKVLPLKPGLGLGIAIHATLTARDFFLANFKNISRVFPVLALATPVPT